MSKVLESTSIISSRLQQSSVPGKMLNVFRVRFGITTIICAELAMSMNQPLVAKGSIHPAGVVLTFKMADEDKGCFNRLVQAVATCVATIVDPITANIPAM